jgi:uncharacterized membrane protein YfcA
MRAQRRRSRSGSLAARARRSGVVRAGYLGSAIGLALGTLRLPLMILLASSPSTAAGTNIGISAASAAAGSVRHAREGRVSWPVIWCMLPSSSAGAFLGGYLAATCPRPRCSRWPPRSSSSTGSTCSCGRSTRSRARGCGFAPAVLGGLGVGALGGAIGVILGTMRMPVLLRGVGMTAAKAVGTNLVVGFAVAVEAAL